MCSSMNISFVTVTLALGSKVAFAQIEASLLFSKKKIASSNIMVVKMHRLRGINFNT